MTVLIRDDHRFSSTAVQITKLVVLLDVERCLEKIVKVILNSDVIYSKDLRRTGLPTHVVDFLAKCALAGHELVVPETTQIEFEKEQEKARLARISELEKAATVLRQNKVDVPEFSPADLVQSVGLSDLLGQISGLSYAIHEASLGDYKLALRKACLREPPHPPDSKSDEMRDLVIWQTAMRIANESGGALLVSRDEVHTHHRGDIEAAEHQLLRVQTQFIARMRRG